VPYLLKTLFSKLTSKIHPCLFVLLFDTIDMMIFFNRILLIIGFSLVSSIVLLAQSTSQLEAALKKASSSSEKIELKMQLAEAYMRSDLSKAARHAQDAYDIARGKRNYQKMAEISYLDGDIHVKRKDSRKAEARYKAAAENAKKAKDNALAFKSYQKLAKTANSNRNYKEAYSYANEALKFAGSGRSSGGSSSSTNTSSSSTDSGKMARLTNDNRQLVKDKKALETEVIALKNELSNYGSNNSKLTEREKKLAEEQAEALKELERRKKALESLENEKEQAEERTQRYVDRYKKLSEEEKEQAYLLEKKEKELLLAEMKQAEASKYTLYAGAGAGILGLLSLLIFGRLRANRKAKKTLEAKNKEVEEEKQKADELLLNILPSSIAQELKENGKAKAQKFENASVLFTDFKNFSHISEKLTPEALVAELDHCFKAFDYIISQYDNIEKIKTIGDAYMCASGLDNRRGVPNNLVKAGMEMQDFLNDYKGERIRKGLPFFEARIGVHTGPVVAGVVGFNKFAYDIWGDTVNIAARMEANCEVGKVNISESTYNQVKYKFDCQYRGKIAAKNKGQIDMYYVEKTV